MTEEYERKKTALPVNPLQHSHNNRYHYYLFSCSNHIHRLFSLLYHKLRLLSCIHRCLQRACCMSQKRPPTRLMVVCYGEQCTVRGYSMHSVLCGIRRKLTQCHKRPAITNKIYEKMRINSFSAADHITFPFNSEYQFNWKEGIKTILSVDGFRCNCLIVRWESCFVWYALALNINSSKILLA